MKTHLLCLPFFMAFSVTVAFSQPEICRNIYVWPFVNESGEQNNITNNLTSCVEEALTSAYCTVLQRSNYATLMQHEENESAIQSLEGLSPDATQELQTIQAEMVLFGKVAEDFEGNIILTISFQNLMTKENKLTRSLSLIGVEAHNLEARKEKVRRLIQSCVDPGSMDEEKAWTQAKTIDTEDAYQKYLDNYPSGNYASVARKVLEDETYWKTILAERNASRRIDLLEEYRLQYNRHSNDADAMLEELLWQRKKYQRYLELYPDGKYAGMAREKLENRSGFLEKVADAVTDALTQDKTEPETTTDQPTEPGEAAPPPSTPTPSTSPPPVSVSAFQNEAPGAENNYEVFVQEGAQIQHYWRSWADGLWHKGAKIGVNVQSAPFVFRNRAAGSENNYELFVRENNQIQHYWYNWKTQQWGKGSSFGANVQSAPVAFQNSAPAARYNYEVLVREGDHVQHYWRGWSDGQWHKAQQFGTNVQSAPAVFQNEAPGAQYNYELFVREGDYLQHYWYTWADGQWRKGARVGPNILSEAAVFQNQAPGSKYNYEIFVREGDHIQHFGFNWQTKQLARGQSVGANVQSAPAVFQNRAPGGQYNYELFVLENNAVQHYWCNWNNGQWLKAGGMENLK